MPKLVRMALLKAIRESVAVNSTNIKRQVVSGLTRNNGIFTKVIVGESSYLSDIPCCKFSISSFSFFYKTLSRNISKGMIMIANVIQIIFIKFDVLYLSNLTA
jgi:hypothetical protein